VPEAASRAGRVCPHIGDAADEIRVTAQIWVKSAARLLPAARDEVAEQCARLVAGIRRDSAH
jgi:hypothetical protein